MAKAEYRPGQAASGCRARFVVRWFTPATATRCAVFRVYIRPHFGEVAGSRCAKAPLGVSHRCAPSRVSKTGLMQNGLRSAAGASAVGAPRSLARPTRRRLVALVLVLRPGCLVRRFALCSGQWPAASLCCQPPLTRWASPLRAELPVRPPGGSLSPRAGRCKPTAAARHLYSPLGFVMKSWSYTDKIGSLKNAPIARRQLCVQTTVL